jgi:hypothetical protein
VLDKPTVADLLKAEQEKQQPVSIDDEDYDIYAELGDWEDEEKEAGEREKPGGE